MTELRLHASEILGFGAALLFEMSGIELGSYSPTRVLNHRTQRRWTPDQWYAVLEPYYERIVNPTPFPESVHSP